MLSENKKIESLIFLFSVFAFLLFLGTAYNSFYWMDDFWKRHEVIHQGFFSFQKEMYFKWDGRAISPIYSLRNLFLYLIDYPQAWALTLIGIGFLTATGYFGLRIVADQIWKSWSNLSKWTYTLLFSLVLVLVFRPHLSRSLYWGTGTYYMISLYFSVLTVYSLKRFPNSIWNFLLIVISCTSGPNNGLMILGFLFLGRILGIINCQRSHFLGLLIMGSLSLAMVIISPGNFTRAGDSFNWNLWSLGTGFFKVLKEYSGMSLWVAIGGVFLGLVIDLNNSRHNLNHALLFMGTALISILPFIPFPMAASKHTALFFQIFMLLGVIDLTSFLKFYFLKSIPHQLSSVASFVLLVYFIYQIQIQLTTGYRIKQQMDKRFEVLEKHRGTSAEITFEPITIPDNNWVSRFWDMEGNPEYFSNKYHQRYFGTGEIIVRPEF